MLTIIAVVRDFLLLRDLHHDHLYNIPLTLLLATMSMLLCITYIHVKASTPPLLSRMLTILLIEYGHEKRKRFIKYPVQDAILHYRSILVETDVQKHPKIYHLSASAAIRTTCGILSQENVQTHPKIYHPSVSPAIRAIRGILSQGRTQMTPHRRYPRNHEEFLPPFDSNIIWAKIVWTKAQHPPSRSPAGKNTKKRSAYTPVMEDNFEEQV
jgi:hypothetical protein